MIPMFNFSLVPSRRADLPADVLTQPLNEMLAASAAESLMNALRVLRLL
jgi:hypothetical protein